MRLKSSSDDSGYDGDDKMAQITLLQEEFQRFIYVDPFAPHNKFIQCCNIWFCKEVSETQRDCQHTFERYFLCSHQQNSRGWNLFLIDLDFRKLEVKVLAGSVVW